MRKLLIPAVTIAALTFATNCEAGPIRNLVARLKGKPRAAAAKVLNVAKAPVKAVRGGCANGRCAAK